jgi:presenilin-like A22 family membrane protease
MLKARIPVLFVWPSSWRFDWNETFGLGDTDDDADEVTGDLADDEEIEERVSWGLGMADLLIPAGFAASVAAHSPPPLTNATLVVVGGILGGLLVASLRLRYKMETAGSGAGLPAITSGVLGGYALAVVAVSVVTTALGSPQVVIG